MLSNGTNFAAIGAAVGEIYWNNQFLVFVFYYIRFWATLAKELVNLNQRPLSATVF